VTGWHEEHWEDKYYANDINSIIFSFVLGNTTRDYFNAKLRLVEYLTNNSERVKEILPARDNNTPVDVKIKIKLRQITDVVSSLISLYIYWSEHFVWEIWD
jgi:hypothetical protein